ncbi:MAG TPA: formate dehydrogenase subunit delta [Actinophytocola sp.]|uniref:formate dehydrogenase subunit delta n=1 Tax=Actinophytocola sp. TaxID=1872138 RepID=UPI002DB74BB4|nr:formate dehydrogenase subunit delta [Actinophytocola sp.]HEU5469862.1 formate dehydrogenase subunit delta [Actinophytocola sp.]
MASAVPAQVRLANEIAVQFHHRPADEAASAIANHIRMFWAPSMRTDLLTRAETDTAYLDPLVLEALRLLRN